MNTFSIDQEVMESMLTNGGSSLWDLTFEHPVLLVFLRHFGCTFCREALSDIAKIKPRIEELGTKVIFVHMTENKIADRYFQRYQLAGATHISDPECKFYAEFGLVKGNFTQLFGLQSWIRGFQAGIIEGNGISYKQVGDGFQMPGVFVIQEGKIKDAFIHRLSHDRPDYEGLIANCCEVN
jgi:peroxiredoxin